MTIGSLQIEMEKGCMINMILLSQRNRGNKRKASMAILHDVVSKDFLNLVGEHRLIWRFSWKICTFQINPNLNGMFTLSDRIRDSSLSTVSYFLPKYHCEHRKKTQSTDTGWKYLCRLLVFFTSVDEAPITIVCHKDNECKFRQSIFQYFQSIILFFSLPLYSPALDTIELCGYSKDHRTAFLWYCKDITKASIIVGDLKGINHQQYGPGG